MNISTDAFLPVVDRFGTSRRVSLGAALSAAGNFGAIHHPSPLVTVACYRLLLAVLQRVFGADVAEHGASWWVAGRFPPEPLNAYFEEWGAHFDLFDARRPFLQVVDLPPELSRRPWTALAAEKSSGNNKTLFDHALDADPEPLPAADAALYLLAAQAMALGGGRSAFQYTAHAPAATAVLALITGENLFQTLLLNLLPQSRAEHERDVTTWERGGALTVEHMQGGPTVGYRGPAQLYSLPARSIRLFPDAVGVMVNHVGLASGERLKDAEGKDPMVSYRMDAERGPVPMQLHYERAFWRDLHALRPRSATAHQTSGHTPPAVLRAAATLLSRVRSGLKPRLTVFGQCTDKAKVELWRCESVPLSQALLNDSDAWDTIRSVLALAEDQAKVLHDACYRLAFEQKRGALEPDPKAVRALVQTFPMLPMYWAILGAAFNDWVSNLGDEDSDAARQQWRKEVAYALRDAWRLADRVVPATYRGDRSLYEAEKGIRRALVALTPQDPSMEDVT
ncbi:type I-E CRISPR-associated protein Cse1/CasA [Silanimonas sp.]|uniref:type I-E CRISPR-associated protein Cse1/CasA n=1 Tax=Silanimonas sp. TaxID=1929290 RepID=UPI001BBCA2B0|nr:type I-E CRISPR-associated protein Cse1/CasA [Silanimonas sp.]MBS3896244.1 type I-E CRISPR-associated protein Cse1/CasA [Silanimonas sp.]